MKEQIRKAITRFTEYLLSWAVLCFISSLWGFIKPLYNLNENQILYLFSSASQVVAAIYGLIITGYIFLRNELDRKADEDDSFVEIVGSLKKENHISISVISFFTILTILLCFAVICIEADDNKLVKTVAINSTVSTIFIQLVAVVMFVVQILNPKNIEIASNALLNKNRISTSEQTGSLESFLMNFNRIEGILEKYGTAFMGNDSIHTDPNRRKRVSKAFLVNVLSKEKKINEDLKYNLLKLITLRNGLVHGTNVFVSQEDVEFSKKVKDELQIILGVN